MLINPQLAGSLGILQQMSLDVSLFFHEQERIMLS
jgi:hypothetical protein